MRPGGGRAKGANFERASCLQLSLWVSGGARGDLFTRNIGSGGKFTVAHKRGEETGMPGDMMAGHHTAFDFCTLFSIECKHYADLELDKYLCDRLDKSFLGKVYTFTELQGRHAGLRPMVIAKQDRKPALVLIDNDIGDLMLDNAYPRKLVQFHRLHQDSYMCIPMDLMTDYVHAAKFLKAVKDMK